MPTTMECGPISGSMRTSRNPASRRRTIELGAPAIPPRNRGLTLNSHLVPAHEAVAPDLESADLRRHQHAGGRVDELEVHHVVDCQLTDLLVDLLPLGDVLGPPRLADQVRRLGNVVPSALT